MWQYIVIMFLLICAFIQSVRSFGTPYKVNKPKPVERVISSVILALLTYLMYTFYTLTPSLVGYAMMTIVLYNTLRAWVSLSFDKEVVNQHEAGAVIFNLLWIIANSYYYFKFVA